MCYHLLNVLNTFGSPFVFVCVYFLPPYLRWQIGQRRKVELKVKLYRFGSPFTVCVSVYCFVISQTPQNIPLSTCVDVCFCVCVWSKFLWFSLPFFAFVFFLCISVFMFWFVYTRPSFAFRFLAYSNSVCCLYVYVFVCCFQYNGLFFFFLFHFTVLRPILFRTLARENCIGKKWNKIHSKYSQQLPYKYLFFVFFYVCLKKKFVCVCLHRHAHTLIDFFSLHIN